MAKIPGTNVASTIAPFTTDDQFPTHDAIYGKGGQREVATIAERDAIPSARLTEGCTCYVAATEKTYRWKSNAWVDDTPDIPDAVTSVISNHELVLQTPDGQSVKGKVGITTGADGLLHLTLTDEEGHVYSSPIAGLRVVGNALQYSNDGETWVTVQTFGKLAIKYAQASDPASGDEGDLALVGTTNAYVLKVYVGGSWVSVCDFGALDLTSDGITMAGENKTLTDFKADVDSVLLGESVELSPIDSTSLTTYYIDSDGSFAQRGPTYSTYKCHIFEVMAGKSYIINNQDSSGRGLMYGVYTEMPTTATTADKCIQKGPTKSSSSSKEETIKIDEGGAYLCVGVFNNATYGVVQAAQYIDVKGAISENNAKVDGLVENPTVKIKQSAPCLDGYKYNLNAVGQIVASSDYSIGLPFYISDAESLIVTNYSASNPVCFYDKDMLNPTYVSVPSGGVIDKSLFPQGAVWACCGYGASGGSVVKVCKSENLELHLTNKYSIRSVDASAVGAILKTNGEPNSSSSWSSYRYSPFILLEGECLYSLGMVLNGTNIAAVAFYDANKDYLGNTTIMGDVAPSGACYARITWNASSVPSSDTCDVVMVSVKNVDYGAMIAENVNEGMAELDERVSDIEEELGNTSFGNNLAGKKCLIFGDSMAGAYVISHADQKGWPLWLRDLTGVVVSGNFFNKNGGTLGLRLNVDQATADELQLKNKVNDITSEQSDAALVVIYCGTNDFGAGIPIGDYYDVAQDGEKSAPVDTTTTSGGLHALINGIRTKCANAKIVYITPPPREKGGASGNFGSHCKNSQDKYLQDYTDCIKDICAFYSIPVLDLLSISQLDINESNYQRYDNGDNLHLSGAAHKEIGYLLARFIENNVVIVD